VRGDAGTGHDSTAGPSRDTANANGSVANTFDAQKVSDDMAVQQGVAQVGMQVVGNIGRAAHWGDDSAARIESHAAVAALGAALGGGNVAGAVGGTVAGDIAGNAVSSATGGAPGGALIGNIASGAAGALAGGALGGAGGAMSGANGALGADLYNRQLHPDERKWAKDNASKFAEFYKDQTGQSISADQAQQMLLASGYRMVDAAASKGLGGDKYATAFISQNAGSLFTAATADYNNPFLYGNVDGSRTPEQNALPGAVPNPAAGLTIAAALAAPALLPALASIPGAPIFGIDGALGSTAMTSAAGTGAISAGINAGSQYIQNGSISPLDVAAAFEAGAVGTYGGLAWNVAVNAFSGAATTAINNALNGKNDSVFGAGITSGAFSSIGYGAGAITANTINSIMRPTISNAGSWVGTGVWSGSGYNVFNPNITAVIGGGITGGTLQEIVHGAINRAQQTGSKK
jgi:filamentous hemagglutinin